MAKLIVIPDCHGQEHWKIAKSVVEEVDYVIFLGDFWDHWTTGFNRQMSNFEQIIKFKSKHQDKVKLLWGNHETSYYLGEQASGYQFNHSYEIEEALKTAQSFFDIVFIQDNWILAHGGVSKEWLKVCAIDNDVTRINQLFKDSPHYFQFVGPNEYGDNPNEGPLWIRPDSLKKTAISGFNQCIGHTEVWNENVPLLIEHSNNGKLLLVDSSKHNCIIQLDTKTGVYKRI